MTTDHPTVRAAHELVDADHLARIARGDREALRQLYERYGARVLAFARRLLGDAHEAEEVTQDVFVRVWRRAGDYDVERASPWAWLAVMTRSASIDRLRHRRRRPDLAAHAGASAPETLENVAHSDPHECQETTPPSGDVGELLKMLRPAERECVAHIFFGGLSQAETAERTGLPLGTVKTHLRRGLLRLRQFISRHDS